MEQIAEARPDAVDVPGGDFHENRAKISMLS
jgi:hypothetical protein